MATYKNIYGDPPPGWDPGHAIMPSQIQRNANKVYGLLNTVGTILEGVDRSRQASRKGGYAEILADGVHNNIGRVALLILDRMNRPTDYDNHLFDDVGQYTFDNAGNMYLNGVKVKDVQRTVKPSRNEVVNQTEPYGYNDDYEEDIPSTFIGSSDYNSENVTENMSNLNQYLGGSNSRVATRPAAPATTTTITFVDLQNANKPVVDKLEIVCQLLGKIWGVEMETQKLIKSLPDELIPYMNGAELGEELPDGAEEMLQAVQDEADAELNAENYLQVEGVEIPEEEHTQEEVSEQPAARKVRRPKTKK